MNNILPIYTSLQHVIGLKFLSLNEKYKFDKETKILHFYGTMSNKISYKIRLVNDALKVSEYFRKIRLMSYDKHFFLYK
jgi:hypothetical protein